MANSNIKQIQSRQVAENQSHQVSRQKNQAQRSCSETYENIMLTINLIGPTRPIQISSKCKVDKLQSH